MPWNSLTNTTGIVVMQVVQEQLAQATAAAEQARENLELTTRKLDRLMQYGCSTREEREAAVPTMEVGALCWGTPSSQQHAME
jgi:hypothetical protein